MTMPGAIIAARILGSPHGQQSVNEYADESELRSFCLSFQPDNKIHLFPPSNQTAQLLRDTVEKNWKLDTVNHGIDCYTLELEGTPFLMYSSRETALLVKYVCCLILEQFKSIGWELMACTDLSNKTDLTAWYFSREPFDDYGRPLRSPNQGNASLVCLSLSATRKLQLINAPSALQTILKDVVLESYAPGLEQDAHYGRDYQIKLKGSPWDTENRDEIVAACKLILAMFHEFGTSGYHLYGLVNLKDTADSLFFEYDPTQTLNSDLYMIMALDDANILRLINANRKVVDVVRSAIDYYWLHGLEAEGRIGQGKGRSPRKRNKGSEEQTEDALCWEFVLKGSPWQVAASKIGRSRQFVTYLLDALLAYGWTVVTGLDISRALNKKSALLFQSCPPVRGIRHACMSPLGKQKYQLINAPVSLRELVRQELEDVMVNEKITEDQFVYEMTLRGSGWWVINPEQHHDRTSANPYVYVRKRMGALLQALIDAGWCVIASADVSRQIQEDTDGCAGEGIHSWFVIYCGHVDQSEGAGMPIKVTANSVLQVGGRIGTARPNSSPRHWQRPMSTCPSPRRLSPVKARRSASFRPRRPSPASGEGLKNMSLRVRRRSSGHELKI